MTIFVSRDGGVGSAASPPFFEPICAAVGTEGFPDAIFWLAIAAALRFREGAGTVGAAVATDVLGTLASLFKAFQPLVAAALFGGAGAGGGDCGKPNGTGLSGLRGSSFEELSERYSELRGRAAAWFAISKSISVSSA